MPAVPAGTTGGFRVGIHGVPLPTVSEVSPQDLERVRSAGARTVGIYMDARERQEPDRWASALADDLARAGLDCAYLAGPPARLLVPEEGPRRREVAAASRGLQAVAALGAGALLIGPGGLSADGPWAYDARNLERPARRALVRSLLELGQAADSLGVAVLVEGHQLSVLDSPWTVRELLDEAGPPSLRINLDPVNYLTPPLFARFADAVAEMAASCGPRLAAVHVKDAVIGTGPVVHIDEAPAGKGMLDLSGTVAAARRADVPALVEHLTSANADAAMEHLAALAG